MKQSRALLILVLALCQPPSLEADATVTYNVAQESNAGMDGAIAWQSVFLLADGRICSFGTGNHNDNQSNAVRIIDPVTTPGTVTSYDAFPWTQVVMPPTTGGSNRYVTNYDNHPSIYIPSENKAVWAGHGVFDFAPAVKSWTYGNRAPNTQLYSAFLSDPVGMANIYNPVVGWSTQLDVGVWFGTSAGGGGYPNGYAKITRNPAGPSPWKITYTQISGISGVDRARNSGAVVGKFFYVDGGDVRGFWKIDLETNTLAATLTPYPRPSGEYFPQLVYDSARAKLVLIGKKLFEYDLAAGTWTDITPAVWPGYTNPMGVYHPALNAIFFRGVPVGSTGGAQNFKWHKISFGPAPPPSPPDTQLPAPTNVTVASLSAYLTWAPATDNIGVTGYKVLKGGVEIGNTVIPDFVAVGLTSGSHMFTVKAFDAAGNVAPAGQSVTVTVP